MCFFCSFFHLKQNLIFFNFRRVIFYKGSLPVVLTWNILDTVLMRERGKFFTFSNDFDFSLLSVYLLSNTGNRNIRMTHAK